MVVLFDLTSAASLRCCCATFGFYSPHVALKVQKVEVTCTTFDEAQSSHFTNEKKSMWLTQVFQAQYKAPLVAFIRPIDCVVRVPSLQDLNAFLVISLAKTHRIAVHLNRNSSRGSNPAVRRKKKRHLDIFVGLFVFNSSPA